MKPLSLMQTNWREFIEVSQDILGISPTRGLDDGVFPKHNDPAAILGCLDFENNPKEAMLKLELQKHFFLSFIGELTQDELLLITKYTDLTTYHKSKHGRYAAILSGTLDIWIRAINIKCNDSRFNRVQTDIFDQFCILGFKAVINEL